MDPVVSRDHVLAKVMKATMDPRKIPFDVKRMFWGGFETLVELRADAPARRAAGCLTLRSAMQECQTRGSVL
jgi:hypothetical protein